MSAPSSLVGIVAAGQTSTGCTDPVDSRFDKLAKKILDELGQVSYARDFFAAVDQILLEPSERKFQLAHLEAERRPSRLRHKALAKKQQELELGLSQLIKLTTSRLSSPGVVAAVGPARSASSKFASLPVEVTRPTDQAKQAQQNGNSKRSAIPVSKQAAYPMNRSATVGDTYNLSARRGAPASTIKTTVTSAPRGGQQSNHSKLNASQKINQRRPTRAKLDQVDMEFLTDNSRGNSEADDFDSEDSEDSDDDSNSENFANLAARRAYLGEKFIKQHKEAQVRQLGQQLQPHQHQQQARPLQEISQVQRQKQKFNQTSQQASQVAKSSSNVHLNTTTTTPTSSSSNTSSQQPRSLGNPSTSPSRNTTPTSQSIELSSKETLGHLYKPHMNYSTSLLGNHRLSDDDEIIIIPTASPSSLISSSCCSPAGAPQNTGNTSEPPEEADLSERFSISRTKSFWERLSNTTTTATSNTKQGNISDQADKTVNTSAYLSKQTNCKPKTIATNIQPASSKTGQTDRRTTTTTTATTTICTPRRPEAQPTTTTTTTGGRQLSSSDSYSSSHTESSQEPPLRSIKCDHRRRIDLMMHRQDKFRQTR